MSDYNPFSKDVSLVASEDLDILINEKVSEGWYVEFKSDFPTNIKLAHSIASFANTEGGWLFIGVKSRKDDNSAEEIIGFDASSLSNPVDKIRDVVKNNISPFPFFRVNLVKRSSNNPVLIINISKGLDAPYITKDGRIYRRNGAGSDPVYETDKHIIQNLLERIKKANAYIDDFSSKGLIDKSLIYNCNQAFLQIFIYVYPFEENKILDFFEKEFFLKLSSHFLSPISILEGSVSVSIPMNNISSTSFSYIIKQIPEKYMDLYQVLSVQLYINGNAIINLPIPLLSLKYNDPDYIEKIYEGSENAKKFRDIIAFHESDSLKIVDGYKLFYLVLTLFNYYREFIIKQVFLGNKIGLRFSIAEAQKSLLFFDDSSYIEYMKKYGVPFCLNRKNEFPAFNGGDVATTNIKETPEYELIAIILSALGCPRYLQKDVIEGLPRYLNRMGGKS